MLLRARWAEADLTCSGMCTQNRASVDRLCSWLGVSESVYQLEGSFGIAVMKVRHDTAKNRSAKLRHP